MILTAPTFAALVEAIVNQGQVDALLRSRPDLESYVYDFFRARTFPHAFDYHRQPRRWKRAMDQLSMMWEVSWMRALADGRTAKNMLG